MKPYLSKAADTLRDQINLAFVGRSRKFDGWIGDSKHAVRKSDHNPRPDGEVCAIDVDAGLSDQQGVSYDLADQLRLAAKKDKRISYIISTQVKLLVQDRLWKFRKYTGINPIISTSIFLSNQIKMARSSTSHY
jgi:hypothetical protein